MAHAIGGRRVDARDSFVDGAVDRPDGVAVIRPAPHPSADGPRAESDGGQLKVAAAKPAVFHYTISPVIRVFSSFRMGLGFSKRTIQEKAAFVHEEAGIVGSVSMQDRAARKETMSLRDFESGGPAGCRQIGAPLR